MTSDILSSELIAQVTISPGFVHGVIGQSERRGEVDVKRVYKVKRYALELEGVGERVLSR